MRAQRGFRDLLLVVTAKLLSIAALFGCSLFAARELGASDYGHFAAALSLVLLLDAIVGSPLDLAVVRFGTLHADEPQRFESLQVFLLRSKLVFAVVIFCVCWAYSDALTERLMPGADTALLVLMLACFAAMLLLRGYAALLQVAQRFRFYSSLDITQAAMRIAGIVGLWQCAGSATSFDFFLVFSAAVFFVLLVVVVGVPQRLLACPLPRAKDFRTLYRYVAGTAGIIMLGSATGRSDVPLISATLGPEETGIYSIGVQLAMLGTMLASYVGIVTQPRILDFARRGALGQLLRYNAIGAAVLLGLVVVAQFSLLPVGVPLLFGEGFARSLPIVEILLWGACLDFMIMPVLMPYAIQLETRACLYSELVVALGYFALMPAALAAGISSVAWLVTGTRFVKLCFYALIFVRTRRTHIIKV